METVFDDWVPLADIEPDLKTLRSVCSDRFAYTRASLGSPLTCLAQLYSVETGCSPHTLKYTPCYSSQTATHSNSFETIELLFGMVKDWLDLERLKARTRLGLVSRVMQRLLAFTAARYGNFINQEPSWRLAHYGH